MQPGMITVAYFRHKLQQFTAIKLCRSFHSNLRANKLTEDIKCRVLIVATNGIRTILS